MNLLLDTTIQIDRITGSNERKAAVEKVLSGNELFCSTYVLGEYMGNVINDIVTLYDLYRQTGDIGETGKRITERVFGRSQGRMSKLYANILELCDFQVDEIADTFELYIDLLQDSFYDGLASELLNATDCAKAKRKIVWEDGIPLLEAVSCTQKTDICRICSFWGRHQSEADKLLAEDGIEGRIREILVKGKNQSEQYRGNHCKTLGDTIISLEALDAPCDMSVCSSNRGDFEPICRTIGIGLASPDYSKSRKG